MTIFSGTNSLLFIFSSEATLAKEFLGVLEICDFSNLQRSRNEMQKRHKSFDYTNNKSKYETTLSVSEGREGRRRVTLPRNSRELLPSKWDEEDGVTSPALYLTQETPVNKAAANNRLCNDDCSSRVEETLLQKAEKFKKQEPQLWEERKKEREKRLKEPGQDSEKMEKFLSLYYEQQEESLKRKKEKEYKRKFEVPKLKIQLKHQNYLNSSMSSNFKDLYGDIYENCSVFEKEKFSDIFSCKNIEDQSTFKSEFRIVITKGKYLLNFLKKGAEKYSSCKVRCYFYLGKNNEEKVSKSRPVYVTTKGKARWEHVFLLRGYSNTELEFSYVNLVVTGKAKDERQIIGNTILSGKKAKVWDEKTCSFRNPTATEILHWDEALSYPKTAISASVDLQRSISFDTNGLFISLTQAFSDLEDQKHLRLSPK